ncbi:MAG: glycosyltransferase family 2 protein [Gemmatimonadota bacterium]
MTHPQPHAALRTAVVILTMNQREMTLRCLRSAERLTHAGTRVVLVDNGSTDGTAEAVAEAFPRVRVVRLERNAGVASGRNAGARAACDEGEVDAFFFNDNDTELDPGCVEPLLEALADPGVGLAVPKIRYLERPELLDAAGYRGLTLWRGVRIEPLGQGQIDHGQYDAPRDMGVAPGIVALRRSTFAALGGYDEGFSPFMYEDTDLALRARARGLRIRFVPGSVVYHKGSHTFGGGDYVPEYTRVKGRNLMRLMRRHATLRDWTLFALLGVPGAVARGLVRQARRGDLAPLAGLLRGFAARGARAGGA